MIIPLLSGILIVCKIVQIFCFINKGFILFMDEGEIMRAVTFHGNVFQVKFDIAVLKKNMIHLKTVQPPLRPPPNLLFQWKFTALWFGAL